MTQNSPKVRNFNPISHYKNIDSLLLVCSIHLNPNQGRTVNVPDFDGKSKILQNKPRGAIAMIPKDTKTNNINRDRGTAFRKSMVK
jgi:hypothetical protein